MNRAFAVAMVAACPFPYPRGTPARIYRMAEALIERGHTVHVVTYHLGEEKRSIPFPIHRTPVVPTYQKTEPGPSYQKLFLVDPLLAAVLLRVVRTHPVDLIHAHHYEGLGVSLLVRRFTGLPVVYDAHTLLSSELPYYQLGMTASIKRRLGMSLDRWLPKQACSIIAVSDEIRTALATCGRQPPPVAFIPNGVEQHFFSRCETSGIAAAGRNWLIYTGNFAKYQRIDLMLESFKMVVATHPDARLLIVANEPFEPLIALAEQLGIMPYLELVQADFDHLPELLSRARIALNPRTDCDGLPQKLLNYMAAGKAIVSFSGSAKNLDHAKTALIVENGDVAGFARAIVTLLENTDLAAQLGAAAQATARIEFTWKRTAEKVEQVYAQVLSGRGAKYADV
ncbi:glycosyltransferase family 4 protein [Rhodospirillaceae bacterium SYSU D60014]|uniref:glycosyltransferase family 4 protein n=1 Tax=Virgifigura deserti TaxID=2268457 RepID=UPI000E66D60B